MPGMPWDQPQPDPLTPQQRDFLGYGGVSSSGQPQPGDWFTAMQQPGGMNTGAGQGWAGQPAARTQPMYLPQQSFVSPSLPGNSTQATLAGMGNPSLQPMGGGLSPDMIKRIQLYQLLMQNRGTGGMQFGQNPLANSGQQGGGLIAALLQNPQLLQWFMQQQQGGPGSFPQGGGGVTLAQLLGAPQQQGSTVG